VTWIALWRVRHVAGAERRGEPDRCPAVRL